MLLPLKLRQMLKYLPLTFVVIDTVITFLIVRQTLNSAYEAGVDVSATYTRSVLLTTLQLFIVAFGLYAQNRKGYFITIIAGGLLLRIGFYKLYIEWQETHTLWYWWYYHNGMQEIPRLIIVIALVIYSAYCIMASLKNNNVNNKI